MIIRHKRWCFAPPAPRSYLEEFPPADRVLIQILYNRGVRGQDAVDAFRTHRPAGSTDPCLMLGIEAAVGRIRHAIQQREPIAIYGDYDADGVTGTVLLTESLRHMLAFDSGRAGDEMDARQLVRPYIPHRSQEGYGLSKVALQKLASEGRRLIITVDCGIRAVDQISYANQLGLEVIVTDHHSVGAELPPALAIIDPKQHGEAYPFRKLAGVGVAFKLVQALLGSGMSMKDGEEADLLDLVAIGTVADLVPLVDENRALVKQGLAVLNQANRPGVAALIDSAGLRRGEITATSIGYSIGPRVNAAGRMDHAYLAARTLIEKDLAVATQLAAELNALNRVRQEQTRSLTKVAEKLACETDPEALLVFAIHEDFPSGIVGLIASRLQEQLYRPVVVAEDRGDTAVASCRSIPEFHITQALENCRDLLIKFGGHAAAAGFTVAKSKVPALRRRLADLAASELADKELAPTVDIDAELALGDIIWPLQQAFASLEPCGSANPPPILRSSGVDVVERRAVGRNGDHLKLVLAQDGRFFDAIAFGMGQLINQLPLGEQIEVAYHLEENRWNDEIRLQLNVQDIRAVQEREP